MAIFDNESLSANFESLSIVTRYNNSSNEVNAYPPFVMSNDQLSPNYGMCSSSTYDIFDNLPTQMSKYSRSNARTISNKHMGELGVSHLCKESEQKSRDLCIACSQ